MSVNLDLTKSANVKEVVVGDTVSYTIVVKNTGSVNLKQVMVKDALSSSLKFLEDSIFINFANYKQENISYGVNVGDLNIGDCKIVTFNCKIIDDVDEYISNIAMASYRFKVGSDENFISRHTFSNEVNLSVKSINITVKQEVDKVSAFVGDKITYIIKIKNEGNIDADYIILKDDLVRQVALIPNSFLVDDKVVNGIDFKRGFTINNFTIGKEVIIKYTVKIIEGGLSNKIINFVKINIAYRLYDENILYKSSISNKTVVLVRVSNFKAICIDKCLKTLKHQAPIKEINSVTGKVDILNFYVINGMKATSNEGQKLSGNKLIVKVMLNIIVEYVADDNRQAVFSNAYKIPFSTFIVISSNYVVGSLIKVQGIVEDVYFKKISKNKFFVTSNIFLIAKQ